MLLDLLVSKDQALLVLVVQQAQGRTVGRVALQRIIYFMKALGVEMDYQFDIHHYGPFSDDVSRDTRDLVSLGVLEDAPSESQPTSSYRLGAQADAAIKLHQARVDEARPLVQALLDELMPLTPQRLELIMTLHYAFRVLKAGASRPTSDAVIERFYGFQDRANFSLTDVRTAFDQLVKVGVVRSY
jgi:uncharacterized protein YwgA